MAGLCLLIAQQSTVQSDVFDTKRVVRLKLEITFGRVGRFLPTAISATISTDVHVDFHILSTIIYTSPQLDSECWDEM